MTNILLQQKLYLAFGFALMLFSMPFFTHAAEKKVFLTAGSGTWTVPSDWVSAGSSIEVIAGGAAGGTVTIALNNDLNPEVAQNDILAAGVLLAESEHDGNAGGCHGTCGDGGKDEGGGEPRIFSYGGGGGAYSKITNVAVTPGSVLGYRTATGGTAANLPGGNTYLCNSTTNCANSSGSAVIVRASGGVRSGGGQVKKSFGEFIHAGGNGNFVAQGNKTGGGGAGGSLRDGGSVGDGSVNNGGGGYAGDGGWAGRSFQQQQYGGGGRGRGAPGIIVITYNAITPPNNDMTCSVSVDPTSIAKDGSAKLSWSSNNVDTFYIEGILEDGTHLDPGSQNPNGETTVSPPATITYRGVATRGTGAEKETYTCPDDAKLKVRDDNVPIVTTLAAENIDDTSEQLNATVNPNGSDTRAWFCMDTTEPASASDCPSNRIPQGGIAKGDGTTASPFSEIVTAQKDVTYYFWAVARNEFDIGFGSILHFTIVSPPPLCSPGDPGCTPEPISGDITVIPHRVHPGDLATVSWSFSEADSCTIVGTNGQSFTGTSGSSATWPIQYTTTYTAYCDDTDADTIEDDFTDSDTVTVLPSYIEL